MKKVNILKYSFLAVFFSALVLLTAFKIRQDWKIKDDYAVKFIHPDAEGVFKSFTGKLVFDENAPENASFDIRIFAKSVDSGNSMQNESIVSDTWLHAEKYPEVTFKAEGALKVDDKWQTTGKLFLHGVENEITVPFTFSKTDEGGLFESTFSLSFIDYKMSEDADEKIILQLKVPVSKN